MWEDAQRVCGISGHAGFRPEPGLLGRMAGALKHRGPDAHGRWVDGDCGLAVERLALVDVAGGSQPVANEDGSVVLGLNGEIYNHEELRRELEARGHRFRSRSDAEVVVHLYEDEGIASVARLRGMFGIALFDRRSRELFLVRDRFGIKPVHYWHRGARLLFASELKALLASGLVARDARPEAADAYLRLRYVPGPGTLLREVAKLPPAHWLRFRDGVAHLERYWTLGHAHPEARPDTEWRDEFEYLLGESVRLHLRGDVPVAAYLSGGLDSSVLVAEAARLQPSLATFSLRLDGEADESGAARAAAAASGARHHEIRCTPADLSCWPQVVWAADQPPNAVALPMFVLARGTREHAKAVLSGEGADEVLGGYSSHLVAELVRRARSAGAGGLARAARWAAEALPRSPLDLRFDHPAALGESGWRRVRHVLAAASRAPLPRVWEAAISLFDDAELAALYRRDGPLAASSPLAATSATEAPASLDDMLRWQFETWLPDNVLARQDSMSMAHGIEARVPYLDHVLVQFLFRLPPHLKRTLLPPRRKVLLRDLARRRLPAQVADRRKQSFTLPLEDRLESPAFRDLLERTLGEAQVRRRGWFDAAAVTALLERARSQREFVPAKQVLALILLELWLQQFVDPPAPAA